MLFYYKMQIKITNVRFFFSVKSVVIFRAAFNIRLRAKILPVYNLI